MIIAPILIVKLSMLGLSVLSFLLLIVLIIHQKLYQGKAAKLILSLSSAQLILVFLPLIIYLLKYRSYQEDSLDPYCQLQGYTMLIGWSICSFISIYMSFFTLLALRERAGSNKYKLYFIIFFGTFTIWIIIYALLVRYFSQGFQEFPWHFNGQLYYVFCSCSSTWFIVIYAILDALQVTLWLVLWRLLQREKAKLGQQIDNILIDTQWFGFIQVVLWIINSFFKLLDLQNIYNERNIIMEIIFFVGNQIYDLNGFISLLMFLYLFREQMFITKWFMKQMSIREVTLYIDSTDSLIKTVDQAQNTILKNEKSHTNSS